MLDNLLSRDWKTVNRVNKGKVKGEYDEDVTPVHDDRKPAPHKDSKGGRRRQSKTTGKTPDAKEFGSFGDFTTTSTNQDSGDDPFLTRLQSRPEGTRPKFGISSVPFEEQRLGKIEQDLADKDNGTFRLSEIKKAAGPETPEQMKGGLYLEMLRHIRTDYGYLNFEQCLKSLLSDETIHFWKEIERLHVETDEAKIVDRIHNIARVFLDIEEENEAELFEIDTFVKESINVDALKKMKCIKNYKMGKYTKDIFDPLVVDVVQQMHAHWLTPYEAGSKVYVAKVLVKNQGEKKVEKNVTSKPSQRKAGGMRLPSVPKISGGKQSRRWESDTESDSETRGWITDDSEDGTAQPLVINCTLF